MTKDIKNKKRKIMRIESEKNAFVKKVKKLSKSAKYRKECGVFLVEVPKMLDEMKVECIEAICITEEETLEKIKNIAIEEAIENGEIQIFLLAKQLLKDMSSQVHSSGIICLYKMENRQPILHKNGLYIILEDIQDPGNLGTIIRLADATAIDGIFVTKETVDRYNPKVVSSTMGSIFRVPYEEVSSMTDILKKCKEKEVSLYGACLEESKYHFAYEYQGGTAFVIGNEGKGLAEATKKELPYKVKIPMPGSAESLNASVATSVLVYEAIRQRMKI